MARADLVSAVTTAQWLVRRFTRYFVVLLALHCDVERRARAAPNWSTGPLNPGGPVKPKLYQLLIPGGRRVATRRC